MLYKGTCLIQVWGCARVFGMSEHSYHRKVNMGQASPVCGQVPTHHFICVELNWSVPVCSVCTKLQIQCFIQLQQGAVAPIQKNTVINCAPFCCNGQYPSTHHHTASSISVIKVLHWLYYNGALYFPIHPQFS